VVGIEGEEWFVLHSLTPGLRMVLVLLQ